MEHLGAARRKTDDSHIYKHQMMEHEGEQGKFMFKVVSVHRTALNRQVREALRIMRRGGLDGGVLNSKAEWSRSHIPRLVLELEEDDQRKLRLVQEKQKGRSLTKS